MNAENFQLLLDLVGPAIALMRESVNFITLDSVKSLGYTGRTYGSTVHTTRTYVTGKSIA